MERTKNTNYPVLRLFKVVSLNTFVKNQNHKIPFPYILSIYPFLPLVLMYNVVSFDRGFFRPYAIIHP